jgi:cyclopropane fatty-acyl-phospholipid synthase-like methyltransferase
MHGFNDDYAANAAPWDIGRPQPAFVELGKSGSVQGSVLDVGCGTGENALYFASLGHDVWGVDSAPLAIERAQRKAAERGLSARFLVQDALALQDLGRIFDNAIDSGLFHVFSDEQRPSYVASLARVLRPGGRYFMQCFSDQQPGDWGPRRVSQAEIRAAFAQGWRIDAIEAAIFANSFEPSGSRSWFCSLTRLAEPES